MDLEKRLRKTCIKMQRKILKVSKKLFNISSFPLLFQDMYERKQLLEKNIGKDIRDFTDEDIIKMSVEYASWKTMNRLCDIYMDVTRFMVFDLHDVLEDSWTQENSKE